MRMRAWTALMAAAIAAGGIAWACADTTEPPHWDLAKNHYDASGSSAMLSPANDTRVNLMLLLADRGGTPLVDPAARREGPPLLLFPWDAMSAMAAPPAPDADAAYWTATRCQSNAAGAAAFVAAVRANAQLSAEEKQQLEAARQGFAPTCSNEAAAPRAVSVSSAAGKAFAAYLGAAANFYGERFEAARAGFAALADAPDPWLRETALYMVARTELNRAQTSSLDEYGWMAEPEARDQAAIAAAGAAFAAYLQAYPEGRYASSAQGLTRRVAWLAADGKALAAAYDRQLARPEGAEGAGDAVAMAEEIDHKLLGTEGAAGEARNPLLAAVVALRRMRCAEDWETPEPDCLPRLTRAELEQQAPLFAGEPALFDYLRAAEAFFVRGEPKEVLALIPDGAHQPRFTYVEFSRQTLRGLALEATGDRNARAFWLSLMPGAVQPYQRGALELALALHDERSGHVDRIFAQGSPVRHPLIRQMLLEEVAGPDLLRRQARAADAPVQEREIATYMLLSRSLHRGFYRDFLDDIRLLPAETPTNRWHYRAREYDPGYAAELSRPPLWQFGPEASVGDIGCPALLSTVERLAEAPQAIGPRLCLAEYFRRNGFDYFDVDYGDPDEPRRGLASSEPQFPGTPYQRLEVYKAIIADPAATPDQRALALNRAIRCYRPSGINSCGGREVPLDQRRAWFVQLKRDHPGSRWAQTLKYYW